MHSSSAAPQHLDLCILPVQLFSESIFYSCICPILFGDDHCKFCNRWDYLLDANCLGIHHFFSPFVSYNTLILVLILFPVIKMPLDCVLIEDKKLKVAEVFYLLWQLHPEKHEASGLQFSSFLSPLHISESSLHLLGNSLHQLSPNFCLKGKYKYPNYRWGSTVSDAVRWQSDISVPLTSGELLCLVMLQGTFTCTVSPHS